MMLRCLEWNGFGRCVQIRHPTRATKALWTLRLNARTIAQSGVFPRLRCYMRFWNIAHVDGRDWQYSTVVCKQKASPDRLPSPLQGDLRFSTIDSDNDTVAQESFYCTFPIHVVHFRDHDGPENAQTQRRLLRSRPGDGIRGRESGPATTGFERRGSVPGSVPFSGWHKSRFYEIWSWLQYILRCTHILLSMVWDPTDGR